MSFFLYRVLCSFIKRNDVLAFEELSQTASIKVSTCDHEAGHTVCIDRLLALLLELELHLIFYDFLDWF